ncbi:Transmembrane_domain-containing protein [Hexamita inflata]|uniref:Transmembrane_domain-containing protein n=1 Tax=Hexamita inflata TaxID=28002 RepID=A0ABP1HDS0_9EUKA
MQQPKLQIYIFNSCIVITVSTSPENILFREITKYIYNIYNVFQLLSFNHTCFGVCNNCLSRSLAQNWCQNLQIDLSTFLQFYAPNDCFVPEYCMAAMCAQMYCVILAIALCECASDAKAKIKAERILYLKRFSSLSFSCFVFGYFLSQQEIF